MIKVYLIHRLKHFKIYGLIFDVNATLKHLPYGTKFLRKKAHVNKENLK